MDPERKQTLKSVSVLICVGLWFIPVLAFGAAPVLVVELKPTAEIEGSQVLIMDVADVTGENSDEVAGGQSRHSLKNTGEDFSFEHRATRGTQAFENLAKLAQW